MRIEAACWRDKAVPICGIAPRVKGVIMPQKLIRVALPDLASTIEVSKMGASVAEKKRSERVMAGLSPIVTVARVPLEQSAEKPWMVLVSMVAQPGSSIFCAKLRLSRSTTLTDEDGCML